MMADRPYFLHCSDGTALIPKFLEVSREAKQKMFYYQDSRGLHWNPREENLWRWCRTMLEHTVHPGYKQLLSLSSETLFLNQKVRDKFNTLFDIQTQMIMEIAFSDDVADNLKDSRITEQLIKIPFGIESDIKDSRSVVETISHGIFVEYFDLAVKVWQDSNAKFRELIGDVEYSKNLPELQGHFVKIMGSMTYSVHMNLFPHAGVTIESIGTELPPNMMVESFRFMEKVLMDSLAVEHPELALNYSAHDEEVMHQIVGMAQTVASLSNSLATFYRELKENDKTNILLYRINEWNKSRLKSLGCTFASDFLQFYEDNGYQNHFFQFYKPPTDILDLLMTRTSVISDIFTYLHRIGEAGYPIPVEHTSNINRLVEETIKGLPAKLDEQSEYYLGDLQVRILRMNLIDDYINFVSNKSSVMSECSSEIISGISRMSDLAKELSTSGHVESTVDFSKSWETFLVMYLIFKHNTHGAI